LLADQTNHGAGGGPVQSRFPTRPDVHRGEYLIGLDLLALKFKAAMTEQASAAAQSLEEQVEYLYSAVHVFKLKSPNRERILL